MCQANNATDGDAGCDDAGDGDDGGDEGEDGDDDGDSRSFDSRADAQVNAGHPGTRMDGPRTPRGIVQGLPMGTQASILGGRGLALLGPVHAKGPCDDRGPGGDDRDHLAIGPDLIRGRGCGLGRGAQGQQTSRAKSSRGSRARSSRGSRARGSRGSRARGSRCSRARGIRRKVAAQGAPGILAVTMYAAVSKPTARARLARKCTSPAAGPRGPWPRNTRRSLPQDIASGAAQEDGLGRRGRSLGRGTPGRRARPILGALFAPIWTRHGCARGRGEPGAKAFRAKMPMDVVLDTPREKDGTKHHD